MDVDDFGAKPLLRNKVIKKKGRSRAILIEMKKE